MLTSVNCIRGQALSPIEERDLLPQLVARHAIQDQNEPFQNRFHGLYGTNAVKNMERTYSGGFGLRMQAFTPVPTPPGFQAILNRAQVWMGSAVSISFLPVRPITYDYTRNAKIRKVVLYSAGNNPTNTFNVTLDELQPVKKIPLRALGGERRLEIWSQSDIDFCSQHTTCGACTSHEVCHWAGIDVGPVRTEGCFVKEALFPNRTPLTCECEAFDSVSSCLALPTLLDVAAQINADVSPPVILPSGHTFQSEVLRHATLLLSQVQAETKLARARLFRQPPSQRCRVCAAVVIWHRYNGKKQLRFSLPLRQTSDVLLAVGEMGGSFTVDVAATTSYHDAYHPFNRAQIGCFGAGGISTNNEHVALPISMPSRRRHFNIPFAASDNVTSPILLSQLESEADNDRTVDEDLLRPADAEDDTQREENYRSTCWLSYNATTYPSDDMIPYLSKIIERHLWPDRHWIRKSILAATRIRKFRALYNDDVNSHASRNITDRYYLWRYRGVDNSINSQSFAPGAVAGSNENWYGLCLVNYNVLTHDVSMAFAASCNSVGGIYTAITTADNRPAIEYASPSTPPVVTNAETSFVYHGYTYPRYLYVHSPANYHAIANNYVFTTRIAPRGDDGVLGVAFYVNLRATKSGTVQHSKQESGSEGFYMVEWGVYPYSGCDESGSAPPTPGPRPNTLRLLYVPYQLNPTNVQVLSQLPLEGFGYEAQSELLITVAIRESVREVYDMRSSQLVRITGNEIQVVATLHPESTLSSGASGVEEPPMSTEDHATLPPYTLSYFHTDPKRPRGGTFGVYAAGMASAVFGQLEVYQMIDPAPPKLVPTDRAERATLPPINLVASELPKLVLNMAINADAYRLSRAPGLFSIPYIRGDVQTLMWFPKVPAPRRGVHIYMPAPMSCRYQLRAVTGLSGEIRLTCPSGDVDCSLVADLGSPLSAFTNKSGSIYAEDYIMLHPSETGCSPLTALISVRLPYDTSDEVPLYGSTSPRFPLFCKTNTSFWLPETKLPRSDPTLAEFELLDECEDCSAMSTYLQGAAYTASVVGMNRPLCIWRVPAIYELAQLHLWGDFRYLTEPASNSFSLPRYQQDLTRFAESGGITSDWVSSLDTKLVNSERWPMLQIPSTARPAQLTAAPQMDSLNTAKASESRRVIPLSGEAVHADESATSVRGVVALELREQVEITEDVPVSSRLNSEAVFESYDYGAASNTLFYTTAVRNPHSVNSGGVLLRTSVPIPHRCSVVPGQEETTEAQEMEMEACSQGNLPTDLPPIQATLSTSSYATTLLYVH